MILELCKGVHCVDLDESFQTHTYLQNFVSIQPRTSPVKSRLQALDEAFFLAPVRFLLVEGPVEVQRTQLREDLRIQ